jgi:hypothetical protein
LAFDGYDADFWRKDKIAGASQYGSMKGFMFLANRFKDNLPDIIPENKIKV